MYYAHFGLNEAPFRITPNTDVFFAGGNRGAILEALIYAIEQGEGIIKVSGEVGTGKTMLCNMLQSRLPAHIETVYLAHPSVSPEEILHAIAFELQLKVPRDASRMEVMQALYSYLLERHAQSRQVVIFIEESQNMPLATLEEIRLLSNLETGKHKLLQIVLFGQPELDEHLRHPSIRQLRERITHSFTLPPLTAQEVGEYLMFRMRAVGYKGPDLFSAAVVKRIAQASAGLTRRINLIADKALLAAFSENTHTVQPRHVAAAIRDSEFARDSALASEARKRWLLATGAVVAIAVAAAAAYWGMRSAPASSPVVPSSGEPAPAPAKESQVKDTGSSAAPEPVSRVPQAPATGAATATAGPIPVQHAVALAPDIGSGVPQVQDTVALETAEAESRTPAAPETSLSSDPPDGEPDVLTERILATIQWLAREPPDTLTIQLLGSENPQSLREHLSTIAKSVDISNFYVYRTIARQKPFLTVLYGSFGSRAAAQSALERLPAALKAFKPYLRTVQGIREEMSRNNTL